MSAPLLSVKDLTKTFASRGSLLRRGPNGVQAVAGISFDIARGSTFSLVGESGCGKSTTARCIMRIVEPTSGAVLFDGVDLVPLDEAQLRQHRPRFQMVFQDPQASLNPRQRVRDIIAEPLVIRGDDATAVAERVDRLARQVQLRPDDLERFPHQFSGGQRQRIGIARALALQPDLIILDEPVSALDVSVQAQIVRLLKSLRDELGLSFLLIAHDLAVVRQLSDRVGVMYLGSLVEVGDAAQVYGTPLHPYSQALMSAVPIPDPDIERSRRRIVLSGDPPDPADPPSGCRFRTRCWLADDECSARTPELHEFEPGHFVACHRAGAVPVAVGSAHREQATR